MLPTYSSLKTPSRNDNPNIYNHLLHRLFLDHDIIYDIIFNFLTTLKKFKKTLNYVLNAFENIMENGAFDPKEQMLHFP